MCLVIKSVCRQYDTAKYYAISDLACVYKSEAALYESCVWHCLCILHDQEKKPCCYKYAI